MSFPGFHGKNYETASYFLDDLEMAFLASRRDEDEVKLRAFPLVLKDEAKTWFQWLPVVTKGDWDTLTETFLAKYVTDSSPKRLWEKLVCLQQDTLGSYSAHEA